MKIVHPPPFPTRVFINLTNLQANLRLLQKLAGRAALFPAVKANAYGHGARKVVSQCLKEGYNTFCVAHLAEALALKQAGLQAHYLIMTPFLPPLADEIVRHSFMPVVCTLEQVHRLARAVKKQNKSVKIHLKVDTGMGRVGIKEKDVFPFLNAVKQAQGVEIEGVMSHYPRADEMDASYTSTQTKRFEKIRKKLRPYQIPCFHIANSAALAHQDNAAFDAVRPGIALYGLNPFGLKESSTMADLKPVMSWKTRVVFLKEVSAGTGLSYGHAFVASSRMLIATLPVGYGDGLRRILSNKMEVIIGGKRCPQVGRICMDQTLVDVSSLEGQVKVGDEVVLLGRQGTAEMSAEEMADKASTINYEVVTGITSRVPRIFIS